MRKFPLISYREIGAPPSAVRSKVRISPMSSLLQQQLLAILPKAEPGFRSALPQAEPASVPAMAQPQPAAVPATSVQMLVQMAAADASVDRRRRIAEKAGRGLALLERLHAETIVPPAGVEALRGLENWLDTFEMPEDVELAGLMQEIELRVRVELAKHEMLV